MNRRTFTKTSLFAAISTILPLKLFGGENVRVVREMFVPKSTFGGQILVEGVSYYLMVLCHILFEESSNKEKFRSTLMREFSKLYRPKIGTMLYDCDKNSFHIRASVGIEPDDFTLQLLSDGSLKIHVGDKRQLLERS